MQRKVNTSLRTIVFSALIGVGLGLFGSDLVTAYSQPPTLPGDCPPGQYCMPIGCMNRSPASTDSAPETCVYNYNYCPQNILCDHDTEALVP